MEETTQEIIRGPQRASLLWIGLSVAGAAASWLACVIFTLAYTGDNEALFTVYGVNAATVVTGVAIAAVTRYVLQEAAAHDHRALGRQFDGEFHLAAGRLRDLQRDFELFAARAVAQHEQISAKLTKLATVPGYWDGYADGVEEKLTGTDNVRQFRRP